MSPRKLHWFEKRVYDERYEEWRKSVLKRDKKRCRFPNCKCRRRLQVHHILPWATFPQFRYSVSNGISLCTEHHKMVSYGREGFYTKLFQTIVNNKVE